MDATTGVTPEVTSGADESKQGDAEKAAPPISEAELQRDLAATLAARRELGPEYDAQLIEAFVEKVTTQLSAQLEDMQRQLKKAKLHGAPSHEQRLGLAIVSIVMLIPLVAIVLGAGAGLTGLALLLLAIIAINLGFRFL